MRGFLARLTAEQAKRRDRERQARRDARGPDTQLPVNDTDQAPAACAEPKDFDAAKHHPGAPAWIAKIHNDIG